MKRARRPSGLVAAVAAAAIVVPEAAVGMEIEAGTVGVEEIAEIAATAGNFSAGRFFILKLDLLEGARLFVKSAPQLSGDQRQIHSDTLFCLSALTFYTTPSQSLQAQSQFHLNRNNLFTALQIFYLQRNTITCTIPLESTGVFRSCFFRPFGQIPFDSQFCVRNVP